MLKFSLLCISLKSRSRRNISLHVATWRKTDDIEEEASWLSLVCSSIIADQDLANLNVLSRPPSDVMDAIPSPSPLAEQYSSFQSEHRFSSRRKNCWKNSQTRTHQLWFVRFRMWFPRRATLRHLIDCSLNFKLFPAFTTPTAFLRLHNRRLIPSQFTPTSTVFQVTTDSSSRRASLQ